jgi:hypothetical protein
MTDPYRTSTGGAKCIRCKQGMLADGDDLVCGDGCGTWLTNASIKRSMPLDAIGTARANPFRAHPFKPARCMVCKEPLVDHYAGTGAVVISFGQCPEHGVWLERAGRAELLSVHAEAIRAHEKQLDAEERREREAAHDRAVRHANVRRSLEGTDTVSLEGLVERIAELERLVAELRGARR